MDHPSAGHSPSEAHEEGCYKAYDTNVLFLGRREGGGGGSWPGRLIQRLDILPMHPTPRTKLGNSSFLLKYTYHFVSFAHHINIPVFGI